MKGQEMLHFAREGLNLDEAGRITVEPLGKRGSDRAFFRLSWSPDNTAILVKYDPARKENSFHAAIAAFLDRINVPVPRTIRHDPERHLLLMEDLGDRDLWSLRNDGPEGREKLYSLVLAALYRLHSFAEKDFPREDVPLMQPFDRDLYKWEQDYFREHFVHAVCRIPMDPGFAQSLEAELSDLAEHLLSGPRCLVHRDFQSQNVMIHKDKPVFIDFQGMRFGSPFYDLASLLYDPYVDLTEPERARYLALYYDLLPWGYNTTTFERRFREAAVQRLMQALGAYGFLGLSRGLSPFLGHIPSGLKNLEAAASLLDALPHLRQLLGLCREAWEKRKDRINGGSS